MALLLVLKSLSLYWNKYTITPAVNIQLLLNLKTYNNGIETLLVSFWNF
jgi:hypothetical protein